jgi:hypothetical protein
MNNDFIKELSQSFSKYNCKADISNDVLILNFDGQPSTRKYLAQLYEVDDAGTLGLKITWSFGSLVDPNAIGGILVFNYNKFSKMGPLCGALMPVENGPIRFLFVGQLIYPAGTPADEMATILFNNAFLNYTLFQLDIPGVKVFE